LFADKVPQSIIKNRAKDLVQIDLIKRKEFINNNIGKKRKAVKIGTDKAITDNYITIKANTQSFNEKIFELIVDKDSEI
jgi:threonylcarbamoyladenosine tRNA methylthiotransferase MtaB